TRSPLDRVSVTSISTAYVAGGGTSVRQRVSASVGTDVRCPIHHAPTTSAASTTTIAPGTMGLEPRASLWCLRDRERPSDLGAGIAELLYNGVNRPHGIHRQAVLARDPVDIATHGFNRTLVRAV